MNIEKIRKSFQAIADAQNWSALHTPKNLACAVSIEAAELLERFQWLDEQQNLELINDDTAKDAIGEEIADVMMYLVALADSLNIDINTAIERNIESNHTRFADTPPPQ